MENSYNLETCFKDIVTGKSIELDLNTLNHILKENLQVKPCYIKPKLKQILPYMLVHFIKGWPGWQKSNNYFNKQISFEKWYQKFIEYLLFKINYLIKNDFEKALSLIKATQLIEDTILFKIDDTTETEKERVDAPFMLCINAPPKMLTSLVFAEGNQENIIAGEYTVNTTWNEELSPSQLINWPYIEVEFRSKELHFKRRVTHDYKRLLTLNSEIVIPKKIETAVEQSELIDENIGRQAYTINTIKQYCASYVSLLRRYQMTMKWTNTRLSEIETILQNFISDIEDINVNNSIATNTSVLFNIGSRSMYTRNKSTKTHDCVICYTEWIMPRILLDVYSFSGLNYIDNKPCFRHFNVTGTEITFYVPKITYKCTYCDISYQNFEEIWFHLTMAHLRELDVLCLKCRIQYKISSLAQNRWAHLCIIPFQ